jgi:hypothetical protein
VAVDVIGLAQQPDDALRQRCGIGGIRDRCLNDDEFIPAHPCDGIALANQSAQPVCDDLQKLVAAGMTECIVHGLELIEIKVMNRHHFVALNPAQRAFEPLIQQHAIGEIGQRVVVSHVFDLDLGSPLLGDVFMGGNPAKVGHRPVTNLEGAPVAQFDNAVRGYRRYRNLAAPVQIFFPRHRGKAACFKTQVDDFGQTGAGPNAVGRKIIHLDVARVAHNQPLGCVEETQSLRHVVDRGVELVVAYPEGFFLLLAELVLLFEAGVHFLPPGNVLMGGHPATVRHWINRIADNPAIGEFLDGRAGNDVGADALADVFVGPRTHLESQIQPVPDQFADGGTGL